MNHLYSRRITIPMKMAAGALLMARWRQERPAELIHHSDQGSQYTSKNFQSLLRRECITSSMSRRGDCWDMDAHILVCCKVSMKVKIRC